MKILIVDDSTTARKMIRGTIANLSFENLSFMEADNGLEALALSQKERPDLIICDVNMPQMDGLEFLAELKKNSIKTTIGFITSSRKSEMVTFLLNKGASFVLNKPFEVSIIQKEIQRIKDAG